MKVTAQHVDALTEVIRPLDTPEQRERYRAHDFPRADAVKDLDRRYRWDLFWEARGHRIIGAAGYNDSHLDTALRHVVPVLG